MFGLRFDDILFFFKEFIRTSFTILLYENNRSRLLVEKNAKVMSFCLTCS